jgi:MYXO-CTERM domain-containing protein
MKTTTLLLAAVALALTPTAYAQWSFLGSDGPGGVSIWHIDHWDHNGIHVDPAPAPAPTVTPEPQSPTVLLALAAAALLQKRRRK